MINFEKIKNFLESPKQESDVPNRRTVKTTTKKAIFAAIDVLWRRWPRAVVEFDRVKCFDAFVFQDTNVHLEGVDDEDEEQNKYIMVNLHMSEEGDFLVVNVDEEINDLPWLNSLMEEIKNEIVVCGYGQLRKTVSNPILP